MEVARQARAHVARLDLSTAQVAVLDGQAHTARALWNLLHELDRGVTVALALSDGTMREHGPWLRGGEKERLRRLEKTSARQRRTRVPGRPTSRRLARTYDRIARLRATAKRRAVDWQHQTTTELARAFGVVVVEDLTITNMVRTATGTIKRPGRNVRQKAGAPSPGRRGAGRSPCWSTRPVIAAGWW
ncbi:hypothetical protein [Microbispora sp. NBC_01389]|uniref:hypothetical protein n=1 Tax=Microbispora sp. NBC_01389 TaxID=2903584 RepID=UPI00324A7185